MIRYEWLVETVGKRGVLRKVSHTGTFRAAMGLADTLRAKGRRVEVSLVRNKINATDETPSDRQWAYLEADGLLPTTFDGGARIPDHFRVETIRYHLPV